MGCMPWCGNTWSWMHFCGHLFVFTSRRRDRVKSEQLSADPLALFEAAWQARPAEADAPAKPDGSDDDAAAGTGESAPKKSQRFRVGIEGRISVLFRGRGMQRCPARGRERVEVLVGAAVLATQLLRLADLSLHRKPARQSKAA